MKATLFPKLTYCESFLSIIQTHQVVLSNQRIEHEPAFGFLYTFPLLSQQNEANTIQTKEKAKKIDFEIINVYKSYNPQNNANARTKFKQHLEIIKNAMTVNCVILGDFNLDYAKAYDVNYCNKNFSSDFDEVLSEFELIQLVKFETWSRMVGFKRRSSI